MYIWRYWYPYPFPTRNCINQVQPLSDLLLWENTLSYHIHLTNWKCTSHLERCFFADMGREMVDLLGVPWKTTIKFTPIHSNPSSSWQPIPTSPRLNFATSSRNWKWLDGKFPNNYWMEDSCMMIGWSIFGWWLDRTLNDDWMSVTIWRKNDWMTSLI